MQKVPPYHGALLLELGFIRFLRLLLLPSGLSQLPLQGRTLRLVRISSLYCQLQTTLSSQAPKSSRTGCCATTLDLSSDLLLLLRGLQQGAVRSVWFAGGCRRCISCGTELPLLEAASKPVSRTLQLWQGGGELELEPACIKMLHVAGQLVRLKRLPSAPGAEKAPQLGGSSGWQADYVPWLQSHALALLHGGIVHKGAVAGGVQHQEVLLHPRQAVSSAPACSRA